MLPCRKIFFFIALFLLLEVIEGNEVVLNRPRRQAPSVNVHQIPKTSFTCSGKKAGGYYADPETLCQVYHVCIPGMNNKMSLISFVCPNGTIFSQATSVCSPYERVDCSLALQFYGTVHGDLNNKPSNYEPDEDYENYVQPAPEKPAPLPRQPLPVSRQSPSVSRQSPSVSRPPVTPVRVQPQISRNTVPPPQPEEINPPSRTTRFRTTSFRGPQSRPVQLPASVRQPTQTSTQSSRQPAQVVRPSVQGFRLPIPGRSSQAATASPIFLPRTTSPSAVSTSTENYSYEYEYEYDYEDELPAEKQGNSRSKRDVITQISETDSNSQSFDASGESIKTTFSCQDKLVGSIYVDVESDCKMLHICIPLSKDKMLDYKIFCESGTAFDRNTGSCRKQSEFKCMSDRFPLQMEGMDLFSLGKKKTYKKTYYLKSKHDPSVFKKQ